GELPMQLQWVTGLIKPDGMIIFSVAGSSPISLTKALEGHCQIGELSYQEGYIHLIASRRPGALSRPHDIERMLDVADTVLSDRLRRLQDVTRKWRRLSKLHNALLEEHSARAHAVEQQTATTESLHKQLHELKVQNLD